MSATRMMASDETTVGCCAPLAQAESASAMISAGSQGPRMREGTCMAPTIFAPWLAEGKNPCYHLYLSAVAFLCPNHPHRSPKGGADWAGSLALSRVRPR